MDLFNRLTNFQLDCLIIAGLAILAIMIGSLFIKGKNIKTPSIDADIRLDIPAKDLDETGNLALTMVSATSANDSRELQKWYKKAARRHKKSLKSIYLWTSITLAIQGLILLIGFGKTITGYSGGQDDDSLIFISVIALFLYGIILFLYLNNINKGVTDVIHSNKYIPINKHRLPAIWAICLNLMNKMELSHCTLNVYYVKTRRVEASVLVEGKKIYLILTGGMITYFQYRPKDVESILGHEFGHVYQGDTKMLMQSRKAIQLPAIIGSVSSGIFILFALLALVTGKGIGQMAAPSVLVLNYWQLVMLRKDSEHLADMASVAFVEGSSLPEVIQKYMPEKGTFNYPSRKARTFYIETIKNGILNKQPFMKYWS